MKTGIRPRVNEAREFLEIAKDFKDPKEIIREALSNSWDASAKKVSLKFDLQRIPGSNRKKIMVEICDDGEGMSSDLRQKYGTSEIEDFFNLGDSHKAYGCIGSKGHGAKIYYKSNGIIVETWKNGQYIKAEMEVNPWESLSNGIVPTYRIDEKELVGKGTKILIDGFLGKQKDFDSADQLIQYILWYSVIGSFGQYFGNPRKMDVDLKPANYPTFLSIPFGFKFPDENKDLSQTSDNFCKLFGPKKIVCGQTESGKKIEVEIIGVVLGEAKRDFVPHTYEMMGLWLCKDYIKIERNNFYVEEVFGGQYYYRSILVFANCQQFDLTANRNNIRTDDEEYHLAVEGIKSFIKEIWDSQLTKNYFEQNKKEKEKKDTEKKEKEKKERLLKKRSEIEKRINRYKGRTDLITSISGAPIKEPMNEAETGLLLQAMITAQHEGIDFRIGEYNTNYGTDLLVEYKSKGIPTYAWVEIVHKLSNLFVWTHSPEGIHKIVCWELGDSNEKQNIQDGREAKLTKKTRGRYNLDIGSDTIDVYILKELL
jgi:hypothetical protein